MMSKLISLAVSAAVVLSLVVPAVASAQYVPAYAMPQYQYQYQNQNQYQYQNYGCVRADNYPYYNTYNNCGQPTLTCSVIYQNVVGGLQATYTAWGGTSPTYNWNTPNQAYLGTGASLTILVPSWNSGNVTVTNGTQVATCTGNNTISTVGTPVYGGTVYPTVISGTVSSAPALTVQYVPALPNTGFAPFDIAGFTTAAILLIIAALFSFPYVRKAFALILR